MFFFKTYIQFRSISSQLMANIENSPDSEQEIDQGDDNQAIGNFE